MAHSNPEPTINASVCSVNESVNAQAPNGFGVLVDLLPDMGVRALVFTENVLPGANSDAIYKAELKFVVNNKDSHLQLKEEDVARTLKISALNSLQF